MLNGTILAIHAFIIRTYRLTYLNIHISGATRDSVISGATRAGIGKIDTENLAARYSTPNAAAIAVIIITLCSILLLTISHIVYAC